MVDRGKARTNKFLISRDERSDELFAPAAREVHAARQY
jgi:hypothetical protein